MEFLPRGESTSIQDPAPEQKPVIPVPTKAQQSHGAIISVILIILMILVGAFYAWGKRINETMMLQSAESVGSTQQ